MIQKLIDGALNSRFLIVVAAVLLLLWGAISFHNLPVEAYPDVANNYVQVITQWPGHAAEEVEQQVTIPIEIVMNGIPHLDHLRSFSVFGLSSLMLIFDDESANDWNRQKVLERLTSGQPAERPATADRVGFQPGGPDLLVHAAQHQPAGRSDGPEVARRLDPREAVQIGSRRGGRGQLRRHHARVPGEGRSAETGAVRPQHRAGGAAARQQQHQRRRQLPGSRAAADQRARHRPGAGRGQHRQHRGQGAGRHAAAHQGHRHRHPGTQDPPGAHRQGDSPRGWQGPRQRRRGGRHRAAAQGGRGRSHPGGHPRQGGGAERPHSAARREDRAAPRSQRAGTLHHAHRAAQPDRRHHSGGADPAYRSWATCAAR